MNTSFDMWEYLYYRGIKKIDSIDLDYEYSIKNDNKKIILDQIELISKFHKAIMGCNLPQRIVKNKIGKNNLCNRTNWRKLNLYYKSIVSPQNSFEELLLNKGEKLIERGDRALESINISDYMNIIKRSMKRNEICIKNTYFDNLVEREKIEVRDINNLSYDLVETDGLYFLNKLKGKNKNIDLNDLIEYFIKVENIQKESKCFMKASLSFPCNFTRCVLRYRYEKKDWDIEYFKKRLLKAIEKDGESLI